MSGLLHPASPISSAAFASTIPIRRSTAAPGAQLGDPSGLPGNYPLQPQLHPFGQLHEELCPQEQPLIKSPSPGSATISDHLDSSTATAGCPGIAVPHLANRRACQERIRLNLILHVIGCRDSLSSASAESRHTRVSRRDLGGYVSTYDCGEIDVVDASAVWRGAACQFIPIRLTGVGQH